MRSVRFCSRALLVTAAVVFVTTAIAAGTNNVRLAVGPFFAPVGNTGLQQASQILPDLLTTELSHVGRYQVVDREKVQVIWSELNLSASGLVWRDTALKLGDLLNCDWLVSGSFAQAGGRTRVWTKLIDVRTGIVLDLDAAPYQPGGFSNTVAEIVSFLTNAGSKPKGREFIAMGSIVNMNSSLQRDREDWSRRISTLIEKQFLEKGYGIVEIGAIGPIFEERRLETVGLTGHPEGRVKLQPAFWLVDGGWEWDETASDKLKVGLRVQKVGGPEQMFHLAETAGDQMERSIIDTISEALKNTNGIAQGAGDAEADLLAARGRELAAASSPFQPRFVAGETAWEMHKQKLEQQERGRENYNSAVATYERILLKDPKNREAKRMLGYALLNHPDSAQRERGKELLRELVDVNDPKNTAYVEWMTSIIRQTDAAVRNRAPIERPNDWESLNEAVSENPNDMEAKCSLGAAMLTLQRVSMRERGRKLLAEVVAGDRPDQAQRAARLLAEPEKTPAVPDPPATSEQSIVSTGEPVLAPEETKERELREFLQSHFEKFMPVQFERDGPSLAKLYRIDVKTNLLHFGDRYYCGVRFTLPKRITGRLEFMHILGKTEAQKDFTAQHFNWGVLPKAGQMKYGHEWYRLDVSSYPKLARKFPYTHSVFAEKVSENALKPGQDYVIWFGFLEKDPPDIDVAITLTSQTGSLLFGILPLQ